MLWSAFTAVLIGTAIASWLIYRGMFDTVFTENGAEFYAEKNPHWKIFPEYMTMPLSTFINFAYVVFGSSWLAKTCNNYDDGIIDKTTSYLILVFNWMAIFYGPIQCLRIITQLHEFAVLDQWYTLPVFTWWFLTLIHVNYKYWNMKTWMIVMLVSSGSYCLSLVFRDGFDIMLGVHILIIFITATVIVSQNCSRSVLYNYVLLFLCNFLFVVLKLADLHLPKYHEVFTVVSGHFLSKIADSLQIHYGNTLLLALVEHKKEREKIAEKEYNFTKVKDPKSKKNE